MKKSIFLYIPVIMLALSAMIHAVQTEPQHNHCMRDGDILNPLVSKDNNAITSKIHLLPDDVIKTVNDTSSYELVEVTTELFYDDDETAKAMIFFQGDTIYFIRNGVRHIYHQTNDTLGYLGYDSRLTRLRLDHAVPVAVYPLGDVNILTDTATATVEYSQQSLLRRASVTSRSETVTGLRTADEDVLLDNLTRLEWGLDLTYDSIFNNTTTGTAAMEGLSRTFTEWYAEGVRYPVIRIEQTVAYYPFGGVIADLGTGHSLQQYKFGGKELLTANGLNEYDFGARRYYQAVPMFTQPDPFAHKFPWLSPYVYCANNPVNVIDPNGKVVIGVDEQAQQNVINTLTEEEASFVEFINGRIDANLLNKCESNTVNMNALKTVVNSKEIFYIETATSYVTKGETKQMADRDKSGSYGVTLLPGASEEPSPDNDVHIYTNIKKSSLQQVENTAHELYGHAYFYALKMQGHDVNPIHDYQNVPSIYENEMGALELIFVFSDVNAKLVDQIKSVSSQAISNYKKRHNK